MISWNCILLQGGSNTNLQKQQLWKKWGKFKPLDQLPLPFAVDTKHTYEDVEPGSRNSSVWMAQPGSGLDKL